MRRLPLIALLAACGIARAESAPPPLPEPVTNNVVAVTVSAGREYIVSVLGLGPGRTWKDLRPGGYLHETGSDRWFALPDIPDGRARVAAAAATVGKHVYIFGGYTIAADGTESSVPYVYRLDVGERRYLRLADMPTPVDDSVALAYQDRYVYLVSGWHDVDNVSLVQLYDTIEDRWHQATSWPGKPVFGHAGAIAGGRMLVCDGVQVQREKSRRRYSPSDECWLGSIDPAVPTAIAWTRVSSHPGQPRYRMAALAHGDRFLFIGGSANPYNYNGIGYDGQPSEPESDALMYDLRQAGWRVANGPAVMDLRALAISSYGIHVIGGMRAGQQVSATIVAVKPGPQNCIPGQLLRKESEC